MTIPSIPETAAAVTVKDAVTAASFLNHLKNNRLEYIGVMILAHLLGVSDRILTQVSGVCF
jgi:hypothetical protein